MDENQFRQLLDRYVQGKCTPEEIKLLHRFYDSFQEEILEDEQDAFDMWLRKERIHRSIKEHIVLQDRQQYDEKNRAAAKLLSLMKIAASVLLVACLGIGSYISYRHMPAPDLVWMEKTTRRGQKATIKLSDGTIVYLNADSKLSFPEHFQTDRREVLLEGEAFFEVVKNSNRPFIIKSGQLTTTVLGTSFSIKAFEGEPLRVTVATGQVKVNTQEGEGISEEVLLRPHQQAYYDGKLRKREVDIREFIAWKDKIIHFEEISLSEAAIVLERWYNMTIVIENKAIQDCKISGQYIDESLVNIMESFQHILGIRYRFEEGRKLIIEGKECKSQQLIQ